MRSGRRYQLRQESALPRSVQRRRGLYAAFIQPGSYGTIGGFLTDRQFHVLDQNDQAIENLFAIGELPRLSCSVIITWARSL
ncbi:MAG: FAD-binding protein [Christensenellales bacterium]